MPPLYARQVRPHAFEAGQGVFQLGQFDLQAGLDGAGPAGEDVEDQLAAVEDLDLGRLFQIADLGRRQIVVEDDHVGIVGLDLLLQLFELALADVGAGIDVLALLDNARRRRRRRPWWPGRAALPADRRRATGGPAGPR